MAATVLPFQGALQMPIMWSGSTRMKTMEAGGYLMQGTLGWRPSVQEVTLSWVLPMADAQDLIEELETGKFNKTYSYTCKHRGAVNIRPKGTYTYDEVHDGLYAHVSASFRRV